MSRDLMGDAASDPGPTESPPATAALDLDDLDWPGPLERVGNYELKRIVAMGGMGVVYEAIQDQPRRSVALKLMRRGLGSAQDIARFECESQLLAQLHHPGIAQVYQAGTQLVQGLPVPYFAMEFVADAMPITDYARAHQLNLKQRIDLMVEVCHAVHHGHQKGIIHRDLKPTNILVDTSGRPKVIDYGLSQAADVPQVVPDSGGGPVLIAGTLPYMSPEQFRTDRIKLDVRLDVYALGVVLYELLCGRLPFQIDVTDVEVATRIISAGGAAPPSSIDPALRGDAEAVLLRAMHKDRGQRYESAEQLAVELTRVLRGEAVFARSDSVVYVLLAWLRRLIIRNRAATGLVGIVLGVMAAQWLAIPLLFRWTRLEAAFERYATTRLSLSGPVMRDVRIIRLTPDTDFKGIADAQRLEGIDPTNKVSLRRLHGRLMEKLAPSSPRVVLWDISFSADTEFDGDFVAGVKALADVGCEVVVGLKSWIPAPGESLISPTIGPHVKAGPMTGGIGPKAPWRAHVAMLPDFGLPVPSASLLAAAAFVKPHTDLLVEFDRPGSNLLTLGFVPRRPHHASDTHRFDDAQVWRVSGLERISELGPADGGATAGTAASLIVDVPPDEVLNSVTLDYQRLFDATPEALRQMFGGRLVVLGDSRRAGGDGPFAHPDGRTLPGYVAQACAVDALIRRKPVQLPVTRELWGLRVPDLWLINAVAGALGVALASVAPSAHVRRLVLLALGAALLLAGSATAYVRLHFLCNPVIAIVAMVVAAEVTASAGRLRRRLAFAS